MIYHDFIFTPRDSYFVHQMLHSLGYHNYKFVVEKNGYEYFMKIEINDAFEKERFLIHVLDGTIQKHLIEKYNITSGAS